MVGASLGALWGTLFGRAAMMMTPAGVVLVVLVAAATGGLTGAILDALIRKAR